MRLATQCVVALIFRPHVYAMDPSGNDPEHITVRRPQFRGFSAPSIVDPSSKYADFTEPSESDVDPASGRADPVEQEQEFDDLTGKMILLVEETTTTTTGYPPLPGYVGDLVKQERPTKGPTKGPVHGPRAAVPASPNSL